MQVHTIGCFDITAAQTIINIITACHRNFLNIGIYIKPDDIVAFKCVSRCKHDITSIQVRYLKRKVNITRMLIIAHFSLTKNCIFFF